MELIFFTFLAALTSIVALYGLKTWYPTKSIPVRRALEAFFEWIGAFALFFAANLTLGVVTVLMIRGFTPRFIALYQLDNLFLPLVSGVQAFVFRCWWAHD